MVLIQQIVVLAQQVVLQQLIAATVLQVVELEVHTTFLIPVLHLLLTLQSLDLDCTPLHPLTLHSLQEELEVISTYHRFSLLIF